MMQRVMIVVGPGSGKSTLARALSGRLGLPVYHMDHIHWQAAWVARDRAEKARLAGRVEALDCWIFEGGLSETCANRVARADTLIWLDLWVALRFWRVIKRSVRWWGRSRPDLPTGCVERFGLETLPFWAFIRRTRHTSRKRLLAVLAAPPQHLQVVHLQRVRQVRAYLAAVQRR